MRCACNLHAHRMLLVRSRIREDPMTLARSVVVPGMITEYGVFADLLDGLTPEQWEVQSRCDGWRVADVAAHVVGQLTDVAALRLDGLGTPEVTARQVQERKGRTASELAEEL